MGRILLASADAASIETLANEVMAQGLDVIEASDGQEAYDLTLSEAPDMVFLAVSLPIFDGYETCEMIRRDPEVSPALPIVFLVKDDVDKRRLEKIGATDILAVVHGDYEVRELLAAHLDPEAFREPES